ncbi:MAG: hypothetical protein JWO39_442 [Gemmatimonadetes bacterium]|nr:hypothetical protein [Gemmatimonadota bacterium]
MTLNSKSFKGGQASFGIFYPTGYVLFVFENGSDADEAAAALGRAGFTSDDMVPASAKDMLAFSRELRGNHGRFVAFERFLSEHLGDEADAANEIVDLADAGKTFLAVYAPDDLATARCADCTRALEPVVKRKFDRFTYTDLR